MKILYHHRVGSKDGQYVHIEELVSALRALGHDIRFVSPKATDELPFGGNSKVIDSLKKFIPGVLYELMELGYSALDYWRLAREIKRYQPDIIYERYSLYFVSGPIARRRFRIPLILEVNAPLYDERSRYGGLAIKWLARWSERFVWRRSDRIFTVTGVLSRRIQQEEIERDNLYVTPNGINSRRFAGGVPRDSSKHDLGLEGRLVLGFVGFAREWHGLEKVIDLLAEKANSGLHFLLVGDGTVRQAIEARARKAGVHERITITGIVDRDQVANYVRAFDIALQPSVVPYASPLKLFEYMACGCAIVAPDMENIREILTHGKDSLLFDPGKSEVFQDAVKRLVEDPGLRRELGEAAKATLIERSLTWEHNAEVVTRIAQELSRSRVAAAWRTGYDK